MFMEENSVDALTCKTSVKYTSDLDLIFFGVFLKHNPCLAGMCELKQKMFNAQV